jgi:signal transduction histidine kinase/ligand-binding sensor domain-containing protein
VSSLKRLLVYLLLLIQAGFLQAQPSINYIEKLSVRDGLSSNAITDIVQDDQGYLWIGTKHGLNRYDGTEVKQFLVGSHSNTIPDNVIYRLLKIDPSHIAIATGHGLSILDTHTNHFQNIFFPSDSIWEAYDNKIVCWEKDHFGNFWAGTPTCILRLDRSMHIKKIFRAGYQRGDISRSRIVYIYSMLPLATGDVLFYLNTGLHVWRPESDSLIKIDRLPDDKLYGFIRTSSFFNCFEVYERYLLRIKNIKANVDSLLVYDEQTGKTGSCAYYSHDIDPSGEYMSLWEPGNGWFGFSFGRKGITLCKIEEREHDLAITYDDRKQMDQYSFGRWLQDKESNWWIATGEEGLLKISPQKQLFKTKVLSTGNGRHSSFEIESLQRIGHHLLIGSYGDGLYEWDPATGALQHHQISKNNYLLNMIWNIRPVSKNRLWLGTGQGILWYDCLNEKQDRIPQTHPKVLDSFPITTQFTDSEGWVWMGIGGGHGVCAYDPRTNRYRVMPNDENAYPYRYPMDIAEDKNGDLWFLSDNVPHLVKWSRKENRFIKIIIPELQRIAYNRSGHFYLSVQTGMIWYGVQSKGLVCYNIQTGQTKIYGVDQGLSTDEIFNIQEDKDGIIWLGTPQGISSFDPATAQFRNYTANDGLTASYFSSRFYYDTAADMMYVGAPGKIIYFSPGAFKNAQTPLRVQFTQMQVNGGEVLLPDSGKIKLPWNKNDITVSFSGINLTSGSENRYAYRLGNGKWIALGNQRQISFASLNPGSYDITIRAARKNEAWSPNMAHLLLTITPPFTSTIWFYLVVIATISLLIYGWYRYRLLQIMKLEKMRFRISHDLHDEIGARLTNIGLMSQIVRQRAQPDHQKEEILKHIQEESQAVSQNMREIIWNINPDNDALEEALPRMLRYASDLLETKMIQVKAVIPELNGIKMDMERRRDLFLIFKEAIHNIVKHSEASQAIIELKLDDKKISLLLSDDGKGFNRDGLPFYNGLRNMEQRAAKHHWQLTIDSRKNEGTRVLLETT